MIKYHTNYINGVSDSEYIYIASTIKTMFEKHFNCFHCKAQYADRKEMALKLRKQKGCFDVSSKVLYRFDQITYKTCIGNFYDPQTAQLVDMFNKFEIGVLPYPGSYTDQPAKIIEVFQLIDSLKQTEVKRIEKENERKEKQKQRQG